MFASDLEEVQRIVVVVCVATCIIKRLILVEEVKTTRISLCTTTFHSNIACTLCLYVQKLCPVDPLVSTIIKLQISMLTCSHRMDNDIGLTCFCLTLVIEDVLVVLTILMELIIIPLCTVRETERAIVVLSIVGGVEATWTSLADGTK